MADSQQLIREINTFSSGLAAAFQTYHTYINNLYTLHSRIMSGRLTREEVNQDRTKANEIFTKLIQYNRGFGALVNKFNKQIGPQIVAQFKNSSASDVKDITYDLVKTADFLDIIGAHELADELDRVAEDINEPIQHQNEGTLSTRYCPDHNGVQAIRISERIYQCPIDGKVYNYETGYTNYKGQRVPGGSIAAQTPNTSDYGGIPMRFYDSRQTVLNRIN